MEIIDGIEIFRKGDTYTVNFISGQEVVIKYNCKINPWCAPEEMESLEVNAPPIKKKQAIREALCVLNITREAVLTDMRKGLATSIQLIDFLSRKLGVEKEWSYLKRVSCENIASLFKLVKDNLPAGSWNFIPKYIEELPKDALPKEVYNSLESKLKAVGEKMYANAQNLLLPVGCFSELQRIVTTMIKKDFPQREIDPNVACVSFWGLVSGALNEDLDRIGVPDEKRQFVIESVIRAAVEEINTKINSQTNLSE